MPLNIETFNAAQGGNALFKALTHPLAAEKIDPLFDKLKKQGSVAIYDPFGQASAFAALYDLSDVKIAHYFVQDVEKLGQHFAKLKAEAITQIEDCKAGSVLVAAFDAEKVIDAIRHLVPSHMAVYSFDDLRLPDAMLSVRAYLSPLNFATNFVFFRDGAGQHTKLFTANYWGGYGAKNVNLWCRLFDNKGGVLAEWNQGMGAANHSFVIDSKEIRTRFALPEFTGQLFIHATGIAGHDIPKYALDTYGDEKSVLSCTHDANAWPSDYYAGLPAPDVGENVVLWVQNSMPFAIPADEIAFSIMGEDNFKSYNQVVPAFATVRVAVADLLPEARWPQQVEVRTGKYMVRPRYEIVSDKGRSRIAHVNVERSDLKSDEYLAKLAAYFGKGHILPSPILPMDRFNSYVLPTPMVRGIQHFPLKALLYDAAGTQVAEHSFGNLPRNHSSLLDVSAILGDKKLQHGFGHVELLYDFAAGQEADGWMHGLFRFEDKKNGHKAESSFGSHMFNGVMVYRGEPQSYAGRAPGLSTRLFLRLGTPHYDAHCHLIYPASTPWHPSSKTDLILYSGAAEEIARLSVQISCGGSYYFRAKDVFDANQLKDAGTNSYVIIRDTTCRLFGYHGLLNGDHAFSLDHMFGF